MKEENENENPDVRKDHFGDDPDNPQQLPLIIEEINKLFGKTKKNIFQIGQLLTKAKRVLRHGNFQQWIKENFDFSYPTANNFMNVYKSCLGRPSLVESIDPSVLYTVTSSQFPEDLREHLFKYEDSLSNIKSSQIKDIMQRYKNKEIDIESPEIKGLIQYGKEKRSYKNHKEEIDHCIDQLRKLEKMIANMSTNITWPTVPDMNKLEITEEQIEKLDDIKEDIGKALDGVFPQAGLVKIIKPSLKKIIEEQESPAPKKQ